MLNDISNRTQDIISYLIFDIVIPLLSPLLRFGFLLSLIIFISSITNYILRLYILPTALISEQLYFDFSAEIPVARVSLLSSQQQWDYIKNNSTSEIGIPVKDKRRFLRSGTFHSINILFVLSKSHFNHAQGKFMLYFLISDSISNPIAKSVRPVVMPYQSQIILAIDAITKWPFYVFGLLRENIKVSVDVMNNYQEPVRGRPSSDLIELTLSTSEVHIESAFLSIYPQVTGISYFMYYYPVISTVVGIAAISSVLMAVAAVYYMISLMMQMTNHENNVANVVDGREPHVLMTDDSDGNNDDDEDFTTTRTNTSNIVNVGDNMERRLPYLPVTSMTRQIINSNNRENLSNDTSHSYGVRESEEMFPLSQQGQLQLSSLRSFPINPSNYRSSSSIPQIPIIRSVGDGGEVVGGVGVSSTFEQEETLSDEEVSDESSGELERNFDVALRLQPPILTRRRVLS